MKLNFPDYALKCLNSITDAGFEAYFVGGCVRDGILGRRCDDIDITTNALPEDIQRLFENTVPTGVKHGTVTVIIEDHSIEVTTYRTESGYADYRHPNDVRFVSKLEDDLSRRDFSINALAYGKDENIIDLFGGINDIKGRLIKAIGDPDIRFKEDALRILRAYRFSSVLGFKIDIKTEKSAMILAPLINEISGERIFTELLKIANGSDLDNFYDFLNSSYLSEFGIINAKVQLDIFRKLSNIIANNSDKLALMLSLTTHNTGIIRQRLKPDNTLYNKLLFLDNLSSNIPHTDTKEALKLLLYEFGLDNVNLLIDYIRLFDEKRAENIQILLDSILMNNEPHTIAQLNIDGNALMSLGFKGKDIGRTLDLLVKYVIRCPENNTEEGLTNYIKKENHQ